MITIGVTGHRPHRLFVSQAKLARRVRGVLKGLIKAQAGKSGGAVLDVNSALAEGADQMVAAAALDLGQRLTVLLPFPKRDYEATFGNNKLVPSFRDLVGKAHKIVALDGRPMRAEAGYVAVGTVTLTRADIILAIWDGKAAQGRGGTPEILQSAIEWGIPVIWVDAAKDRKPMLLMPKRRGKTVPVLDRVARKAILLSPQVYRELIARARPATA